MRKAICILLIVLVIIGVMRTLGLAEIVPSNTYVPVNLGEEECNLPPAENARVEISLADQSQDKYKCMEECAKTRYRCEQDNKDLADTKAASEQSAKCQKQYTYCLENCE